MQDFSGTTKAAALSMIVLMFLAGAVIRPASAIVPVSSPAPTFTLTGTPALEGSLYAVVHNGDLWVCDYTAGQVYEYATPYSTAEAPIVTLSVIACGSLAFDSQGNLWVGTWYEGHVYEFTGPTFASGQSPAITMSGFASPEGITFNQGNLWVTDEELDTVTEFSPEPTTDAPTPTQTITGLSDPISIAFDSANDMWVAEYDPSQILEFANPVSHSETPSVTLSVVGNYPTSITFDPFGNLWVAGLDSDEISMFAAPLTNTTPETPEVTFSTAEELYGISIDSSLNVWAASYQTGAVFEYSGLVQPHAPYVSLPAVMPQHLTFSFQGASSITGNLVSPFGQGGLYNVPHYNNATDIFPTAITECYIAANNTVSVSGFSELDPGSNATEFLATNWISITQSAQGWPSEPACAT